MLSGRVLAASTARSCLDLGIVLENLVQHCLPDKRSELVPYADKAEGFIRLRIQFECFGVQVHLSVEKVEQSILDILYSLVLEVLNLRHLCFDRLDDLN